MKLEAFGPRLFCVILGAWVSARAQAYTIDWFTMDAGGGTSSGGSYEVSGTIGQPDAGTLTGGNYTLQGGFWPGALVMPSTGEAPAMFVQLSGTSVIVSWSPSTPGFVLEQSDNMAPGSWSAAPSGSNDPVTLPTTGQATFYRLHKP